VDDTTYNKYLNLWCGNYDPQGLELENVKKVADLLGRKTLEVGCGNGRFTRIISKHTGRITGIDNDLCMISSARRRTQGKSIEYLAMDGTALAFKENSFDAVIFVRTIAYSEGRPMLREAKRVLRNKGLVLLVEPGTDSDYARVIMQFTKATPPIGIQELYETPLKEIFGRYERAGPVSIPYVFNSRQQAFEVFRFVIQELHHGTADEDALRKHLTVYRHIRESIFFYKAQKQQYT
jgi:ubiquinone/menaquinone biosynthesis C-methylase UbiE